VKPISLILILILLSNFIFVNANSEQYQTKLKQFSIEEEVNYFQSKYDNFLINYNTYFIENRGQLSNGNVFFYARDGSIWFTDDGVWFELREKKGLETKSLEINIGESGNDPIEKYEDSLKNEFNRLIINQDFVGANFSRILGKNKLSCYSNFFIDNNLSKWCINVPNYKEIMYENLYNGINLKYYNNEKGLKYDLIVKPGANVEQIRIRYNGAKGLKINDNGDLIIKNQIKNIVESGLKIYQFYNDTEHIIKGKFIIYNDHEFGFEIIENYNQNENLIIDPIVNLEYSTYLGSFNYDGANDIAVDSEGNAYIIGSTQSPNFPTTPGANDTSFNGGSYDIYVSKMNSNGSNLIYSTFIGGDNYDYGRSISVDPEGNVYSTGDTRSSNFPITDNIYDNTYNALEDVIAFKLNQSGSKLIYSTYIGGNNTDRGYAISIDNNKNAYITGYTISDDFPTTNDVFNSTYTNNDDVFVLKLNYSGSKLIYSTYIGGNNDEIAYDIFVDDFGNSYVTGYTDSIDFPTSQFAFDKTRNGSQDSFVLKLNQTGKTLIYSTYIGGGNSDIARGISVDQVGNAYITGGTWSSDFPTTANAINRTLDDRNEIFVSKINETGSKLIISTLISGNELDEGYDIDLDSSNNIFITGHTTSPNFPVTQNAYDSTLNSRDVFLIQLHSSGSKLIYSSYLGGNGSDYGRALYFDDKNNLYIVGRSYSSDFPTTKTSFNQTYGGSGDAFISKFSFKNDLDIDSVALLKYNIPTNIIYTGYGPYNFIINISDPFSLTDLQELKLSLDPSNTNIQIIWNRQFNEFNKLNDPLDYISIDDTSSVINNSIDKWTINVNLLFNWTYPDEDFHNISVLAINKTQTKYWFNLTNFYRVENDLEFNGILKVAGMYNRFILNNSPVRGGETLKWSGLIPVYEGSSNICPFSDEFDISLWDDLGNHWLDSPQQGEEFEIHMTAPNITNPDGNNYIMNISGIPKNCDKSNIKYNLPIDADNVTFSNPSPSKYQWQKVNRFNVGITITDLGGSQVNGTNIQYKLSLDNGTTWDSWEKVSPLESNESITVEHLLDFENGINNLIKWKSEDTLGNGPVESESYRILVDTENIAFSNAIPLITDVSTTEEVLVGITISDTTSGVNASSIEYSISSDRGTTWGQWIPVKDLENGSEVIVRLNTTFQNGTNNYLRWRATDIAGNGPVISPVYPINVNTWVPKKRPEVTLLSPPSGISINTTSIDLKWQLDSMGFSNIIHDLYFGNNSPPGLFLTDIKETNITINNLKNRNEYYWKIIPRANGVNGTCKSGIWWFDVKLPIDQEIYDIDLTGPKAVTIYPGENKTINLIITNLGSSDDMIKLQVQTEQFPGEINFKDISLIELENNNYEMREVVISIPKSAKLGVYQVILSAISINSGEYVKVDHTLTIEIKEFEDDDPNNQTKPNGNDTNPNGTGPGETKQPSENISDMIYLIIIVIIVVVILLVAVAIISKRKKKSELPTTEAITFKPGALPTTVISQGDSADDLFAQPSAATSLPNSGQQPAVLGASTQTQIMSAPSTVVSTQTPIPKVPSFTQKPQLPPAQLKKEDTKEPETSVPQEQLIINEIPQITQPIIEQTETTVIEEITPEASTLPIPQPVQQLQPQTIEQQIAPQDIQEPNLDIPDFGPDPDQPQEVAIEHEVVEEPVIEPPDMQQATAELTAAETVEISDDQSGIVHEGDKGVWRPQVQQEKENRNEKVLEQLKKLGELRNNGTITEEEFQLKKKEIMK
jgi:hypothetical protein